MTQKLSPDLKQAILDSFDDVDEECQGRLDKNGFRQVLQLIGQNPSRAEINKYFKGGRDFVPRDEICNFVENHVTFKSKNTIDDEIASAFAKFDPSEDSLISTADFKEILTKIGDEPLTEAEADKIIQSLNVKDHLNVTEVS